MRNELIPDEAAEAAFDWLHANVDAIAEARAQRIYLTEYRKVLKARIMKEHDDEAIGAQERDAYASPRYEEHLHGLRIAVERDERLQFLKETYFAKIEAWRTAAANRRAQI